jgi:glycosyltransferase involved in cell wall biosynthesis
MGDVAGDGGVAQLQRGLAHGLRCLGHDVDLLGVVPPPGLPARHHRRFGLEAIGRHLLARPRYDVVDVPPPLARRSRATGRLVVRSTQPELRYLAIEARHELARAASGSLRSLVFLPQLVRRRFFVLEGWRAADRLLCLGSLEFDWMRRRFPELAPRLRAYEIAPGEGDRRALAAVRAGRESSAAHARGLGLLWIGRWSAHKGTAGLVRYARERLAARPADRLTIAGCGEAPSLEWASMFGGRVALRPAFGRAELPALLAGHDLGLFTSEAEGWGLSLQEMLESGLPVLATREGAVPELEPYFPGAIGAFPQPPGAALPTGCAPAPGYEERFSWGPIARRYLAAIDAAGEPA